MHCAARRRACRHVTQKLAVRHDAIYTHHGARFSLVHHIKQPAHAVWCFQNLSKRFNRALGILEHFFAKVNEIG
jgi:hypothetical protein